jgi:hypothetical protein
MFSNTFSITPAPSSARPDDEALKIPNRSCILSFVKPLRPAPAEFLTLEGMDYNLLRKAESLAREEFCRPENRELRRRHLHALFPKIGDPKIRLIPPDPGPPPKVL